METDLHLLKQRAAISPTLSEVIYLYKNSILDFEYEKGKLTTELLISKNSLSNIKMALENIGKDDVDLSFDYLSSERLIGKINDSRRIYNDISAKIFKLLQEKNIQEKNLKSLMAQTSSNSALVGEITSVQNNPNKIKFAFQGFIFGVIFSIVLVLIIGKFKAYREEYENTL